MEKQLGKINSFEFGIVEGHIAYRIEFKYPGGGVFNSYHYNNDEIKNILKEAKVLFISELKGKPVELTIKHNSLSSWRILTEVL